MAAIRVVVLFLVTFQFVYCYEELFRKLRDVNSLTEFEKEELARIDENELPNVINRVVRIAKRSSNFCCKHYPIDVITKTKSSARVEVVKSRFKIGNSNCGTLGLSRCSRYDYRYRQVTKYVTEYYQEAVKGECPSSMITCCNYYLQVAGKCVHLDDLSDVVNQLIG